MRTPPEPTVDQAQAMHEAHDRIRDTWGPVNWGTRTQTMCEIWTTAVAAGLVELAAYDIAEEMSGALWYATADHEPLLDPPRRERIALAIAGAALVGGLTALNVAGTTWWPTAIAGTGMAALTYAIASQHRRTRHERRALRDRQRQREAAARRHRPGSTPGKPRGRRTA